MISRAAASSSSLVAVSRAFSTSGRATVTTATAPSRLTSTAIAAALLLCGVGGPLIGPAQLYRTSAAREARLAAIATAGRGRRGSSEAAENDRGPGRSAAPACRPRPSRHPRPEGGSARPGGGRVLPRTLRVGAPRSRRVSGPRFAVGGRVNFLLAPSSEHFASHEYIPLAPALRALPSLRCVPATDRRPSVLNGTHCRPARKCGQSCVSFRFAADAVRCRVGDRRALSHRNAQSRSATAADPSAPAAAARRPLAGGASLSSCTAAPAL